MATKIYDLATKIFPLVASWLPNEKVNFEPCSFTGKINNVINILQLFLYVCKKKKPNIKKHKSIFNEPHKGLTISLKSRINVLSISISAWTRALKTQLNIGHRLILCIFGSKQTTPFIFTFTLFEEATKSMSIVKSS